MLSRTLGFATVSILIGFFVALPARAQNLEAGKSPAQIFSSACSACHKSMRGLVKTVPAGSLPGFLRQHYTTSSNMAAAMSAYLLGHGGVDRRRGEAPGRHGRRDRRDAREQAAPSQQQPTFTPFWMRRPAPPPKAARAKQPSRLPAVTPARPSPPRARTRSRKRRRRRPARRRCRPVPIRCLRSRPPPRMRPRMRPRVSPRGRPRHLKPNRNPSLRRSRRTPNPPHPVPAQQSRRMCPPSPRPPMARRRRAARNPDRYSAGAPSNEAGAGARPENQQLSGRFPAFVR